ERCLPSATGPQRGASSLRRSGSTHTTRSSPERCAPRGGDVVSRRSLRGAMTDTGMTTGRSVLRGGFWYTASRLVPQLYSLVISIAAARFLGPEGMGHQSFIAFTEISLVVLFGNGFFLALMRSVGETLGRDRPEALRGLLRWGWRVQGVSAAAGAAILVVSAELGASPRAAWL